MLGAGTHLLDDRHLDQSCRELPDELLGRGRLQLHHLVHRRGRDRDRCPDDGDARHPARSPTAARPRPSPRASPALQNGESASVLGALLCSTTATSTSPAGTYPIELLGQRTDANYAVNYVGNTVQVVAGTAGRGRLLGLDDLRRYLADDHPELLRVRQR